MRRQFPALLCAALLLLLSLTGCGSLFEKEYLSVSPYEDQDSPGASDTTEIHTYGSLLRALNAMVAQYETDRVLVFADYDGIIADDLAKATWELRSNTALGAYCVRSIDYETEQVVAYCEADVTITYKRTADEVKSIYHAQTRGALTESIVDALRAQRTKFAVQMNTGVLDEADVSALVQLACLNHPLLVVDVPAVDITMYTGGTNQKIFEVTLRYSITQSEIATRRAALSEAVQQLAGAVEAHREDTALLACDAVARVCTADGAAGGTAYEALVLGAADSRGLAMAYKAVCDALDVPCEVVDGQLDSAEHDWNIVEIAGSRYHADLTGYFGTLWLQPDSDIWGRYWWNTEEYSACTSPAFSWQPGQALAEPDA